MSDVQRLTNSSTGGPVFVYVKDGDPKPESCTRWNWSNLAVEAL